MIILSIIFQHFSSEVGKFKYIFLSFGDVGKFKQYITLKLNLNMVKAFSG